MRASLLCQHMESALKSGQSREAIGWGESLLSSLPGHLWAQCLLGQAYLIQGEEGRAQACFDSILERDPECAAAWMGLALLAEAKGQTARASDCRRRAATLSGASTPRQTAAAFGAQPVARPRVQDGDVPQTTGISLDPTSSMPSGAATTQVPPAGLIASYATSFLQTQDGALPSRSCRRAEALWRLGSLVEADREARQALRMAPQSVKAAVLLADITWQRGDDEEFGRWLHRTQRLDPSGVVARRVWGDEHPLLTVVKVNPLLATVVEEGEGGGALDSRARATWGSDGDEAILPPHNPPWLLDFSLPGAGVAGGQEGLSQEAASGAADHGGERIALPRPSPSGRETPRSSGGEADVCPVGGSQPVDAEFEGDEGVGSAPLPRSRPRKDKLDEKPGAIRDPELSEIQLELERIASSLSRPSPPSRPATDRGRRTEPPAEAPLGLIATNRRALEAKYGPSGVLRVEQALSALAEAMSNEGRMETLVVCFDDPQALQPYGLAPPDPRDPGELKMTLDRLRDSLRNERGGGREEPVTYLLLIGGDDIVPFHPLPNLNEDEDELILTDHPYACFGDDYALPGCAVGRLPDGESRNVDFLLRLITIATEAHRSPARQTSLWQMVREWLGWRSAGLALRAGPNGAGTSFGCTASIWRQAARDVFSSIGQTNALRTSPPLTSDEMDALGPVAPRFSYFNLHGVRDSAYWYGQRDPTYAADYPLFPVALKPDNIPVVPHPEAIVFSEACYGAHIFNKHETSSLALRFLTAQAVGVVGSTALAYGSIAPPLVGADLLAKAFWERVKGGYPLGLALGQAKQSLVQEMMSRQGYLDPEDHKTILSFVLYGDPTLVAQGHSEDGAVKPHAERDEKVWVPGPTFPRAETANAGGNVTGPVLCRRQVVETEFVSPELMNQVRHRLGSYVLSARQRDVSVSAQMLCREAQCNERCSLRQSVAKGHLPAQAKLVFTLRREESALEGDLHQQIVKATVDREGNVVKLAISR